MNNLNLIDEILYNASADSLGEVLRDIIFIDDGVRSLDFINQAVESNDTNAKAEFWKKITQVIYPEESYHTGVEDFISDAEESTLVSLTFDDGTVVSASWLWDGDLILGFSIKPVEGNLIYLLNGDAKKKYNWRDATEKREDSFTCSALLAN